MKIIVPMAGMGKRMRPHTLTIPKPLIRIAGKPIVQRLVEGIVDVSEDKVDEIAFIIGDFGKDVEEQLLKIAEDLHCKGSIYYQDEALGTAHAIYCAAPILDGPLTIAFADTLFDADFTLDKNKDGIIWTHKVQDPSAFGVVVKNEEGVITSFAEKPKEFISDEAIIGIYYFKDGKMLGEEIKHLIDHKIITSGEYQLTDALQNLMQKGLKFHTSSVREWLDCGNKDATVHTNQRILELHKFETLISSESSQFNSIIIEPCYIGKNAMIEHSIIGPHVSVGENTIIKDSIIRNSIIQTNSDVRCAHIENSMLGNHVNYEGTFHELSIGDFTRFSRRNSN